MGSRSLAVFVQLVLTLNRSDEYALGPFLLPSDVRANDHETPVSTKQGKARTDPRVPRSHGDPRWSSCDQSSARQGSQEARFLSRETSGIADAAATTAARATFPPSARLRSKADFEAIYARGGRRFDDTYFGLRVQQNQLGRPRLGLAVAVKTMGSAVARNRVRRLIRESFRLEQATLPTVDIVVAARNRTRDATPGELRASLATFWNRIKAQCATPSEP